MRDVQKDLPDYFHSKSKPIAPAIFLFSTGMMEVFFTNHILMYQTGQWDSFSFSHAVHLSPEKFTNDQHSTYSRNPDSQTFFYLHLFKRLQVYPVCGLRPSSYSETDTHILTSNWKKYWEVFGFLGSS